jgi:transposase-like protein
MARRARHTFTPEFKAKLVLDVLTGAASQAEVCRKHQISPTLFGLWKATPLASLSSVLQSDEERSAEAALAVPAVGLPAGRAVPHAGGSGR